MTGTKQKTLATAMMLTVGIWLSLAPPLAAGVVTTGGGVLYEEQANPWFLENTANVSYCLEIDTEHMHLSPDLIRSRVRQAFGAWQQALRAAAATAQPDPNLVPYGLVRLATQEFNEEPCRASTQLRFQFGVLSSAQKRLLPNPRRYVASTVRTEYDEVNLVGKGFVYVSPDSGPLRPTASSFAADPWSVCDGCLLGRTLMHELGHVFGMVHEGGSGDLMGARSLEYLTRQELADELTKPTVAEHFEVDYTRVDLFAFPAAFTDNECVNDFANSDLKRFFHIPSTWRCVQLAINTAGNPTLQVYASPDQSMPPQLVGSAANPADERSRYGRDSDILISLTAKQRVFDHLPMDVAANGYLLGPDAFERELRTLVYRSLDETYSVPLLLTLQPSLHFSIIGELDRKLVEILSY